MFQTSQPGCISKALTLLKRPLHRAAVEHGTREPSMPFDVVEGLPREREAVGALADPVHALLAELPRMNRSSKPQESTSARAKNPVGLDPRK